MYKIKSETKISKELLVKYPDTIERIINNMLVDIANKMFRNGCFEGFDWHNTKEKYEFCHAVILDKRFDLFFEKYPKK